MKTKTSLNPILCLFTFAFLIVLGVNAQTLTVQQIMAEPSIAGMRVEGEKLSPDGTKVIYLWNAEGKLPRDLYLSSTDKADSKIILRLSDLPKPSASPAPENKLNYGLVVRDEFVKARENALGNFEWSPDSKKLVFSQGGDLYVLDLASATSPNQKEMMWKNVESILVRFSNLVETMVKKLSEVRLENKNSVESLSKSRDKLIASIEVSAAKNDDQKRSVLQAEKELEIALDRLLVKAELPHYLKSIKGFPELFDESYGVQNRINVARIDYNDSRQNSNPKRYTKTQAPEFGPRFLDNDRILFQQSGNLFVLNTSDATLVQLTKDANPQNFISVGGGTPNKAGTMIAYIVSDNSKQKNVFLPNYLDENVQTPTFRRGWSEQKLYAVPTDGSRDAPFEIKLPKSEGVSGFRRMAWAADGRSLIVDRNDKDTKRRQLFYVFNVGSKDEQIINISDETDDKWQASLSVIFEPNPKDAGQLFFCSEKDGYNHIYLATLEKRITEPKPDGVIRQENLGNSGYTEKVDVKQLTKGNWQVEWAKWTNEKQIAFASSQDSSSERQFSLLWLPGEEISSLQKQPGMKANFQMSEATSEQILLYEVSEWNKPGEILSQKICVDCHSPNKTFRLTNTIPDAFSKRSWSEPKFIDIPSRDSKIIKAKIYLPTGFDKAKKYPMVIFVHGAGYLQNVINGWNNYYREFMFNELLTQKGYVVLDIDYRGSAGYGREWRTDVYDFLGGKDMDDHLDGIDYMIKNYAVDPAKVGVYGGSYGGFMAEMLAFRASDKIAAAAALRPVGDWKNYYVSSPQYTAQRLGFPDKNPEGYKRSSPISYADGLKTNLLILHGMVDDNVPVQDSQQLIEKLIRLGKTQYFEAMLYPSESHGFVRPESWTDEYTRILAFFEKNLK